MRLGQIIGRVVATRRDPGLRDHRLLLVQPLDAGHRRAGAPEVMLDAAGAGSDEVVLYVTGKEAALCLPSHACPADATIIAIVDHYDVNGEDRPGINPTP